MKEHRRKNFFINCLCFNKFISYTLALTRVAKSVTSTPLLRFHETSLILVSIKNEFWFILVKKTTLYLTVMQNYDRRGTRSGGKADKPVGWVRPGNPGDSSCSRPPALWTHSPFWHSRVHGAANAAANNHVDNTTGDDQRRESRWAPDRSRL